MLAELIEVLSSNKILLEVACGARLRGRLAAANRDGGIHCDHLGEDVQDRLVSVNTLEGQNCSTAGGLPWGQSYRRC